MSLAAISALKTLLSGNADLTAYFMSRYKKDARHFVGYKRGNANDYPMISYVPARAKRGGNPYDAELIAIVVSVNEPGCINDIYDGVAVLADIEALILAAMQDGMIGVNIIWADGLADVIPDLGAKHPFYETEIQITLLRRTV